MSTSLKGTLSMSVTGVQTSTIDLGSAPFSFALSHSVGLTNGTGTNMADKLFTDTRTLSASGTEDLDLAGVLTDAFGSTLALAKVKAVFVVADSGNTND